MAFADEEFEDVFGEDVFEQEVDDIAIFLHGWIRLKLCSRI